MRWRENPRDAGGRAMTRLSRVVLAALVAITLLCAAVAVRVDPLAWALVGALVLIAGLWTTAMRP